MLGSNKFNWLPGAPGPVPTFDSRFRFKSGNWVSESAIDPVGRGARQRLSLRMRTGG